MPRFKVGDVVTVRKDLNLKDDYKMVEGIEDNLVPDMVKFLGQKVTISLVYEEYSIKEDNEDWCWTDEMFEEGRE